MTNFQKKYNCERANKYKRLRIIEERSKSLFKIADQKKLRNISSTTTENGGQCPVELKSHIRSRLRKETRPPHKCRYSPSFSVSALPSAHDLLDVFDILPHGKSRVKFFQISFFTIADSPSAIPDVLLTEPGKKTILKRKVYIRGNLYD